MKNWVLAVSLAAAGTLPAETFVVNEGEEKTLTDDTIVNYDGASVAAGGTLILDTTDAPPFAITGAGLIRKGNALPWTMTVANSAFTGTWDLCGVVTVNGTNPFGAKNSTGYRVVVTNNATLALAKDPTLENMKILLAGTGVDGRGALEVAKFTSTSGYCFRNLVLADDATVSMAKGNCVITAYGKFELNEHTMSVVGGGDLQFMDTAISTNGEIRVSGTAEGTTRISFRSWNSTSPAGGVTDTDNMKFTLAGYGSVYFYNRYKSFSRPLHVRGVGNILQHVEQYSISKDWTCSHLLWKGPIVFEDGGDVTSKLTIYVDSASCCFGVTGPISGPGQIYAYGNGCIYFGYPSNTYTGGTEFGKGTFVLGYPGSIPDYSAFVNTSATSIRYASGDDRWTMQDILDFKDQGANVPAAIRFDTELVGGEEVTAVSLADMTRGFASNETLGNYGDRPTALTGGSTDAEPLTLTWTLGSGELTGVSPYYAYKLNVLNATANDFSTVLTIHDTDVTTDAGGWIGAGIGSSSRAARLVISNAVVHSADPMQLDTFNTAQPVYASPSNSLIVGRGGEGILEIEEGALLTNRLQVGMHGTMVWDSTSFGGVRQRGGKFVAADPNSTVSKGNALGVGQGTGGYYELLGGELESHGTFSIGCWGVGSMLIDGGTFTVTNVLGSSTKGVLEIAASNNGWGALRVTSGRIDYHGADDIFVGRGNTSGCFASLTVDGEDADCDFGATRVNFGWGNPSGTYFVNFNAGVLTAGKLYKHRRSDTDLYCLRNRLYLSFNGGTFRAGAPGEIFGAASDLTRANAVFVCAGGATIDTQGNECTIRIPIAAPEGKGVKSIELAKPITHVMSPVVEITSETGVGASAFAHYDWETHTIDRIDVTSPGSGYEDATVTLRYAPNSTSTTAAIATNFVADAGTGSFTKKGSGILNLGATNTWGGATILAGGMLRCYCDRAIPQDTTVELAGGVLAMNGMKMENGDAFPKKWAVDAERAKELGGTIPYAGAIEFLEGSTLEIRNAAEMDEDGEKLVLLETTGGITGRPAVTGTIDPKWHFRFSSKKIVLAPNRGTVLIMR